MFLLVLAVPALPVVVLGYVVGYGLWSWIGGLLDASLGTSLGEAPRWRDGSPALSCPWVLRVGVPDDGGRGDVRTGPDRRRPPSCPGWSYNRQENVDEGNRARGRFVGDDGRRAHVPPRP
jgi:hypothetical protein